jgi:toxin YoeB
MKGDITFSAKAMHHYVEWQMLDKRIAARINALIKDIQRRGLMNGIGRPEALKHQKAYSRHIDEFHRLVYESDEHQNIRISCKGHYES